MSNLWTSVRVAGGWSFGESGARLPALGRDIEGARRGVGDLRAGHERIGVHGGQPLRHVDREHGEHVDAGVGSRAAHVTAVGQASRAAAPAAAPQEGRSWDPAGEPRPEIVLGKAAGRGGDDHPGRVAVEARADQRAPDPLRAQDAHGARIFHVDLREDRDGPPPEVDARCVLRGVVVGEHQQALAREEQLVAEPGNLDRPEEPRRPSGGDRVYPAGGDREDLRAARLDEVRLVDSRLLDVGRRGLLGVFGLTGRENRLFPPSALRHEPDGRLRQRSAAQWHRGPALRACARSAPGARRT